MAPFPPPPTPYEAPTYEQRVDGPARYRSPAMLATWVTVSLVAGMVADLGSIVSTLIESRSVGEATGGTPIGSETMPVAPMLFALAQLVSYLTTMVLFLIWIARCYRNLEAISRWRLQFGPGWAVGSWFVPFLNLARPFQIMRETLWVSSHPELADEVGAGYTPPGAPLLGFWWAGWLMYGGLTTIGLLLAPTAYTPGALLPVSYLSAISDLVALVNAILAASLVRTISSRQQAAVGARGLVAAPSSLTVA